MNKELFMQTLEASLLYYNGTTYFQLLELGFNPQIATLGIKLSLFLRSKNIEENK